MTNGIDSYDDLCAESSAASGEFHRLSSRLKEVESRQKEISELQKHIATYGKTREIYKQYKAAKNSQAFYNES